MNMAIINIDVGKPGAPRIKLHREGAAGESPEQTPGSPGEALITRTVTVRNSTYGALKTFQREYRGRTGISLTNAAAIDMLLRERLARIIKPRAVQEMVRLSRPGGEVALLTVLDKQEREELADSPSPEGVAP